jgi:uncharacterized membrane protein
MARSRALKRDGVAQAPPVASSRIVAIDALRAIALWAMIAYHFCFDLRHFGVTRFDFERDWGWLSARAAILSSFLLLAGVSLVLAERRAPRSFWRHIAVIAGCALLVSAASYAMFPRTFIWFGVLHAIAVSLVLARPLARAPRAALALGVAVVIAGNLIRHLAFDNRMFGWIGFMTAKPPTEDYVPLFPWAGVVFIGVWLAHAWSARRFAAPAALARAPRWLVWMGRHSLIVYMIHQPLLIGALWLALRL